MGDTGSYGTATESRRRWWNLFRDLDAGSFLLTGVWILSSACTIGYARKVTLMDMTEKIPHDPWALNRTGKETMVYIGRHRIINVNVSGGDYDTVSVSRAAVSARHFIVTGDKRQGSLARQ
jgi:hypothetical protein